VLPFIPSLSRFRRLLAQVAARAQRARDALRPAPLRAEAPAAAVHSDPLLDALRRTCSETYLPYEALTSWSRKTFTFLGEEHPITQVPPASALWQIEYHGHAVFVELATLASENSDAAPVLFSWFDLWLAQQRRAAGLAWHPYTVSSRVLNWLRAASLLNGEARRVFQERIHAPLYSQLQFLAPRTEH
jgi:hypothetical protein